MEVIFNGKRCQEEEVQLSLTNRAFCYGDGIFETMIVRRGTCALLPYHFKRLKRGAETLKMNFSFSIEELEGFIWEIATQYHQQPVLRMRLQLWRKTGGLYSPEKKGTEFLLSATLFLKPDWLKKKAAISEKVQLFNSPFSSLKTMSALPYVLAGQEMQDRQLDEIILTDLYGHVAEGGAANLFWLKEGIWHTPHLESGCIAGVMRSYLIDQLQKHQLPVQEVMVSAESLLEAEALVACNVTGLYTIQQLEYHRFEKGREMLTRFIQLPEL